MATLYGKAAGGNFNGANWSTTGSGGGDSVTPTLADDCILEAGSGNFTVNASSLCRSLDCVGGTGDYAGTLTHTTGVTLNIGDGTAGAGNRALRFSAGMTYTIGSPTSSRIDFISTSTTAQTITTASKTMPSMVFDGAGGSWQLSDANSSASTSTTTLTRGTLDTNGQTCTWGLFSSSNSNTRTLTLGSSAITLSGTSAWNIATATNLTFNSGTSSITFTSATTTVNANTLTYYNMTFSGSGVSTLQTGNPTFNNLTRTGTAAKTDTFVIANAITVNGTFTATGNSVVNRVLVQSSTIGTARTITAAAVSLTNVDFMDITGAGAATWSGTSLGDAGGNSNITFDSPSTQTNTGATGNWSDVTKWTSRVPLPQDNVVINTGSGTITADMPRLGKDIDCTGFGGTLGLTSLANFIYGSLTLVSGMTLSSTQGFTFNGRGTHTVTMAGKSFGGSTTFTMPGGSYSLQDAFSGTGSSSTLAISHGTWNTNNFSVTYALFNGASGSTTTLNLGTSTFSLTSTATATIWNTSTTTTTVNGSTATIAVVNASSNTRTISAHSLLTIGTFTYTVANSPGTLFFAPASGAGTNITIGTLNIGSGRIVQVTAGRGLIINTTFNVNGADNDYIYLPGVAGHYISVPDSAALSITGDIDIRVRVAMDDWTPSSSQIFASKTTGTGNQRSWYLRNDGATGLIRLMLSGDGSTQTTAVSSVAPTVSDGQTLWVRATWRASDDRVQFFTASGSVTSPTSGDWTQLGTDQTISITTIFDSTAPVEVSSTDGGTASSFVLMPAKFYRLQIRNNVLDDGTGIQLDADFTTKAVGANSFTESSSNAATVTINGTLAQAGDGRVSLVSSSAGTAATLSKTAASGTVLCNYLTIQDSTATGGTAWYAANSVNVSGNTGWIFSGLSVPGSMGLLGIGS